MQIDINELIELVKSVKPMFLNHTEAEHVTVKGRADFVTQVDIRVQEYMRNELSKRWPDVQFMGEEKDNSDIDFNGAVWILDPVDGTTNLIHDFKDSALSLGLCEQGHVILSMIFFTFSHSILQVNSFIVNSFANEYLTANLINDFLSVIRNYLYKCL